LIVIRPDTQAGTASARVPLPSPHAGTPSARRATRLVAVVDTVGDDLRLHSRLRLLYHTASRTVIDTPSFTRYRMVLFYDDVRCIVGGGRCSYLICLLMTDT